MRHASILIPVLMVVLAACGDDNPVSSKAVSSKAGETESEYASRVASSALGSEWELTAFVAGEHTARVVEGTTVTLYLADDGQVSGSAGCNRYFASYELLDSARVSIEGVGSTEMACLGEGVMDQESRYLRSLGAATALILSSEYLHLYYGDEGEYLRFAPSADDDSQGGNIAPDSTASDSVAHVPEGLVDRLWQLRFFEYHNDVGSFADAVPEDVEITAAFSGAGKVKGRAGCNEYFGQYELGADGGLAIYDVGITETFCQTPDLMGLEDRYRDLLDDVDAYGVEGDRLILYHGDGSGALHFEAVADSADSPYTPVVHEDTVRVANGLLRYVVYPCSKDCSEDCAETRSPRESVVVVDGNDLYFHQEILSYCNALTDQALSIEPVIDGGQITLNAVFRGPAVRCLCPIPVRGVVEDLTPGTYAVAIAYGAELQDGTHLEPEILYETEVTVGDDPVVDPGDPGPGTGPKPLPADVHLTVSDAGDTIELTRPGTLVEIALEANPSTGFTWLVANGDSTTLLHVGDLFETAAGDLVGQTGVQRLYFEAQAPGQTALRLVYARPWESVPPADTFEVSFTVNADVVSGGIVPLPVDPPVYPLGIRLGSSFGECLGYCWQEMILDEEAMVLMARGWDGEELPEKVYKEEMDPDLWRRLLSVADFVVLDGMDEVYGCPDCADGGAEWVSMNLSGRMETVRFEYGDKLEPIAELLEALRWVREGLVERSGF